MTNADQVRDQLIQALDGRRPIAADMTATLYCTPRACRHCWPAQAAAAAAGVQHAFLRSRAMRRAARRDNTRRVMSGAPL